MDILLIIGLILIISAIRGLFANEVTYKQRSKILERISADAKQRIQDDRDDYLENYEHMNKTTYIKHFWKVFFFQDYRSLYHSDIQGFL